MSIVDSLARRRSYYAIGKSLPVDEEYLIKQISDMVRLVPDAFDMRSQRVVLVLGDRQDELWDAIYDAFGGKVPREKTDGFRAGAGTALFFYDADVVKAMQDRFPRYADNFPLWALQSNGMLQLSVWCALRELGLGASLQHYNPVIDRVVRDLFNLPDSYVLLAQMPFGAIKEEPPVKGEEDISMRMRVMR